MFVYFLGRSTSTIQFAGLLRLQPQDKRTHANTGCPISPILWESEFQFKRHLSNPHVAPRDMYDVSLTLATS